MDALAVVICAPEKLELRRLALTPPAPGQVVVDVEWSGISTGTERLLWNGRMPPFPGMGYPLVPGYESVGRIVATDEATTFNVGDRVFVPGSSCFGEIRGLFGGAASRLVVPASRVVRIEDGLAEDGVLLALAATARRASSAPVVWEKNPARQDGAAGYRVIDPDADPRRDYRSIYDVSGDAALVEPLIGRLARGGELVLAGFYSEPIWFGFPLAFIKEARLRVAAEWQPADLQAVNALIAAGRLPLDGLVTHRRAADQAAEAYQTAFSDPSCLKMLLDWRART